jgi:uroporphyrinogen-III synthase
MLQPVTVQLALRTVSLESRREGELARLLERHGLVPITAPSMREVPLAEQTDALAFGEALFAGECDVLVLLTGVGTRALVTAMESRWARADVLGALSSLSLCCRGPKPVAVLKELGLKPTLVAPEPNTWRELLWAMDPLDLGGRRVWVQEYGRPQDELRAALEDRGAIVRCAAVYAWALPEDLAPLEHAIELLCGGEADAIVFTSGKQIEHVVEVAERLGLRMPLLRVLRERAVVASIGPVTTEALRACGVEPDIEPAHPKMGHLAKALAERAVECLDAKRVRSLGTPT